jgi:predicted GIY-YIG superfamily endonuclease
MMPSLRGCSSAHPELVEGWAVDGSKLKSFWTEMGLDVSFWVYILCCSDGSYYTGHTENLEIRVARHQAGEIAGYTQKKLPVELVFSEEFSSRDDAFIRERQIKGWSRKKKEALNEETGLRW